MSKFLVYAAVYVFLQRDGKVYLMRRANTGYSDGMWSLPAGHIEAGEGIFDAARRELLEEAGIDIPAENLVPKHAMYRRYPERTYADYYFVATDWDGEPRIMEHDKCDAEVWANDSVLPDNTVAEVKRAWANIAAGQPFSDIQF